MSRILQEVRLSETVNKKFSFVKNFIEKDLNWVFACKVVDPQRVMLSGTVTNQEDCVYSSYSFSFDIYEKCIFSLLYYPFKVPAKKVNEMCELVTRINASLWCGKFDYIIDKGVVRFRLFHDLTNVRATSLKDVLNFLVEIPLGVANRYAAIFNRLLETNELPLNVLREGRNETLHKL